MHPKRLPLGGLCAALFLGGCQSTPPQFDTIGDAVGYCMVLSSVPVRVNGEVTCSAAVEMDQAASPD